MNTKKLDKLVFFKLIREHFFDKGLFENQSFLYSKDATYKLQFVSSLTFKGQNSLFSNIKNQFFFVLETNGIILNNTKIILSYKIQNSWKGHFRG